MHLSKRFKAAASAVDDKKAHTIDEAVAAVKAAATAKFTESVDIAVRLGVDPKKADQAIRGTVSLPHGIGREVRVLVLARPPRDEEAKAAGADHAGLADYVQRIQQGWADVDVIVATPDVMGEVGKLGKILGPRGLMPSPKSGTVTDNLPAAIKDAKEGKLDFKMNKFGALNTAVGKISFSKEELIKNIETFLTSLVQIKPQSIKGRFIKSVTLSTTMGPGLKVSLSKEFQV